MSQTYLEVTFRHGKPLAAYYYLPRRPGQRSYRTQRFEPGLIVDFSRGGRPLGIEITASSSTPLSAINRVLASLGLSKLSRAEFAPLRLAA